MYRSKVPCFLLAHGVYSAIHCIVAHTGVFLEVSFSAIWLFHLFDMSCDKVINV